jgi:hypothetical protein
MKFLLLVTGLCFVLSGQAARINPRDTVFLYKGQMILGEILGIEGGIMRIEDVDLGVVNIKLYKIKRIHTPLVCRITTISRAEYYGSIKPADRNGYMYILTQDAAPMMVAIEEINDLIPIEKQFWRRLTGNVTLGFTYTKSSGIGQLNVASSVGYATKTLENKLSFNSISSIDSSKFSRDNEDLELFSLYNIASAWFASASLRYQRNLELSVARRYQEILGGGNKLIVAKRCQLLALSGISFSQEKSTSGEESGMQLELPVSLRFSLYIFSNPNLQITTSQATYIGLTQKGRLRYSGNTSIYYDLFKDFKLNAGSYINYDNKPPSDGVGTNNFDYGLTFGITYRF